MPSSLVELRHDLHRHPELAHAEHQTAARIVGELEPLGPDRLQTGVGGTGVVATFTGGAPGPSVLLRSELDALPIPEVTAGDHGSTHDGVSHKCGHDGHAAILIGVARGLAEHRPARGSVHLLFQPAEETGTGAAAVLADPAFSEIEPDVGFALHNMPGIALHTVVVKPGPITPAVRSIVVSFEGATAHASEPHLGRSPTLAVADLLRHAAELVQPDAGAPGYRVVTPVHVRVGSPAYGVAAGDGEVHLTIRCLDDAGLQELQDELEALASRLAARDGLRMHLDVVEDFPANDNDPGAAAQLRAAAASLGLDIVTPEHLGMPAGEDFGRFSSRFPCCMALLGAGEDRHPIHSPEYDFPDALLETGVRLLTELVHSILGTST